MRKAFILVIAPVVALCLVVGLSAENQVVSDASGVRSIGSSTDEEVKQYPLSEGWPVIETSGQDMIDSAGVGEGRGSIHTAQWQPEDGCAPGVVVVGQTPNREGDPSWYIGVSDLDPGYYGYDYFTGGGWITAVKFWGVTVNIDGGWSPCVEEPLDLAVGFFADAGGYPNGGTIHTTYATVNAMPLGDEMGMSGPLYAYTIVLDTPVYIEEAWVSIVGDMTGTDCDFGWVSGTGGDSHCLRWTGSSYIDHSWDMSFCLVTAGCPRVTNFSQPPDMPDDFPTGWTSDDDLLPQQWCVYENVPTCYLETIRFWGVHGAWSGGWTPCTEEPTAFEIKFYHDDSGEPGVLYETFVVSIEGQPTGLHYWPNFSELYEYQAYLGPTKVFEGWVSIQAQSDPTCHFLWVTSRSGMDNMCLQRDNDAGVYLPKTDDVSLCIIGETTCCGRFTDPWGYSGNANCSIDGKITLSDITAIIDRVYISKLPLCCDLAGNANGDIEGNITLSDITRVIDNVYISKGPTAICINPIP